MHESQLLSQPAMTPEPEIRTALSSAMMTPLDAVTPEQRVWLDVLMR